MKKRSLSLRREALADLSPSDLGTVAGGARTLEGPTCPLIGCVTGLLSNDCYTYNCGTANC